MKTMILLLLNLMLVPGIDVFTKRMQNNLYIQRRVFNRNWWKKGADWTDCLDKIDGGLV